MRVLSHCRAFAPSPQMPVNTFFEVFCNNKCYESVTLLERMIIFAPVILLNTIKMRLFSTLLLSAALAFALTACGEDDEISSTTTEETTTTTTTTTTSTSDVSNLSIAIDSTSLSETVSVPAKATTPTKISSKVSPRNTPSISPIAALPRATKAMSTAFPSASAAPK